MIPPRIDLGGFQKYFVSRFWRAINAQMLDELPVEAQSKIVEGVYSALSAGIYLPSSPKKYLDTNKGFGVVRRAPVFEPKDYCVYFYCVKLIEPYVYGDHVPNTFGGWSLGGVSAKYESAEEKLLQRQSEDDYFSEYTYNPDAWARHYGDFNAKLYKRILDSQVNGGHKFILEFDISNFYDCIRLPILEHKIRNACPEILSEIIDLLFIFLKNWNRADNGNTEHVTGLPQDALQDCSRILAYFYLNEYDRYVERMCNERGCTYFRYADDQMIFADTKEQAYEILRLCSLKLNSLGLNINQKKVDLYTLEGLKHYRSFEVFDIFKDEENKRDLAKVIEFCDAILEIDKASVKNRGYPLIKRLLTANINLLPLDRRTKFLALCYDHDFIVNASSRYYLGRIYSQISDEERRAFLAMIETLAKQYKYSKFLHEVYNFYKDYDLDTAVVRAAIENYEVREGSSLVKEHTHQLNMNAVTQ